MALTVGNYLFLGALFLIGGFLAFVLYRDDDYITATITLGITILAVCGLAVGLNWYHTSMASGIRNYKDYKSELSNGIDREITITAEDGRKIFHYEGKVDIESNHEDNYIKFESEEGKRFIIYYGIQDTITIIEK